MTEENKIKDKIDLAENLIRRGRYDEAVVLCEEIHRKNPEEDSVVMLLAWAYYDSGKTQKAVKYLNALLEKELKRKVFTGFAFDELVRIYKQDKDFRKLTEICEKAVAVQPEDVGLLAELGNAYLQSGEPGKACGIYEKLVGIENDNSAFYCRLGEALFAAGHYADSEKAYLQAAGIDSEQPDRYYFRIAVLHQQAGNHGEAQRLLNKCIDVNSSHPLYYCSLGDSLIGMGQIRDALAAYERAVQCDQRGAGAYYNRLGNALMNAGSFSQAAEAFQSAVTRDPVRLYFLNLASAYRKMGFAGQADMIISEIDKIRQA